MELLEKPLLYESKFHGFNEAQYAHFSWNQYILKYKKHQYYNVIVKIAWRCS